MSSGVARRPASGSASPPVAYRERAVNTSPTPARPGEELGRAEAERVGRLAGERRHRRDDPARGAYQGASEAATATVQMVAPAVFTMALGAFGAGGWLIIAGVFAAAAAPVPALARWAARTR